MTKKTALKRGKKVGSAKQQHLLPLEDLPETAGPGSELVFAEQQEGESQATTEPQFPKLIILPHKMIYYRDPETKDEFLLAKSSKKSKSAVDQKKLEKALKVALEVAKRPGKIACFTKYLDHKDRDRLKAVADSIGPSKGRAIAVYLIEQLAIKWAHPEIDIRLHKLFWRGSISLRRIGQDLVVPFLRQNELIAINQFGAAMTRSLAENYPFTPLYMADVQGAKKDWLELVERVQYGDTKPFPALAFFISLLIKNSERFNELSETVLDMFQQLSNSNWNPSLSNAYKLLKLHIDNAPSKARLLEVAIHSLLQALEDLRETIGGRLRPLMQMRTANQKHGNFGDVEIEAEDTGKVRIAYDAKLHKVSEADLADLKQKLLKSKEDAEHLTEMWFIYYTTSDKESFEVRNLSLKLEELNKILLGKGLRVSIGIKSLEELAQYWIEQVSDSSRSKLPKMWLTAYIESLCLRRKHKAPIEEPTYAWLLVLKEVLHRLQYSHH